MTKKKHYHSPILVENAYVWGALKTSWFFWERPIKEAHWKKIIGFWDAPHLDVPTTSNQNELQVGTLYTFTWHHVSVFWQIFTLFSCKCIWFTFTHDLRITYTIIKFTCTTLELDTRPIYLLEMIQHLKETKEQGQCLLYFEWWKKKNRIFQNFKFLMFNVGIGWILKQICK